MNSTAHTGAAGELFACTYFLSHGLEVFRNVASSGPADLMLYNKENGKSVAVDIKSQRSPHVRVDGTYTYSAKCCLRDDNVWQVLYVHGEASVIVPEGFWDALGMDIA